MTIKNIGNNIMIKLDANPSSIYAILTSIILLILLVLCFVIAYFYQDEIVKAIAFLFIPLALIFFLLKIVIWNFFGQETLLVKKDRIETSLYYNYVYKAQFQTLEYAKYTLFFRSNVSTDLLTKEDANKEEYRKAKFKIHLKFTEEKFYQSAFSINQQEAKELTTLF